MIVLSLFKKLRLILFSFLLFKTFADFKILIELQKAF